MLHHVTSNWAGLDPTGTHASRIVKWLELPNDDDPYSAFLRFRVAVPAPAIPVRDANAKARTEEVILADCQQVLKEHSPVILGTYDAPFYLSQKELLHRLMFGAFPPEVEIAVICIGSPANVLAYEPYVYGTGGSMEELQRMTELLARRLAELRKFSSPAR